MIALKFNLEKKDKNKTMFQLFKNKKGHFVGIDFGTSAIKIVELSYDGEKIHLENYGWVDLDIALQGEKSGPLPQMQTYEAKVKKYLGMLLEKLNLDEKGAYVAIPGFSGLITLVEFPEMSPEELEKAIHFESHKYIPSSIEEIAMSWEVVGTRGGEKTDAADGSVSAAKKVQVLLVAAPKKEIAKYEKLMDGSKLEIAAIELETFSIVRAILDEKMGNSLIIDIGSRATNIVLVENGIVKVNRNIDAGGNEVTNTIADSMTISKQRAEIFKQGEKDLLNGKEAIVMPVLEMIASEGLRIINAYGQKNADFKLDTIVISGGLSKMKGVEEYFSRILNKNVQIANPWRNINFDEKLQKNVAAMGSSFTVAIGLALRGVEDLRHN